MTPTTMTGEYHMSEVECCDSHPFWIEAFYDGHSRFWQFELDDFSDFAAKRMQGYWRQYSRDSAYAERYAAEVES